MKLIEFRAENFARLKVVEIRPDGAIVPITGKNGQGKTSVLRGIWALIEGRAAAPGVSIRLGEDEAHLYGDLGTYKITRTIKHDREGREEWSLKVVDADGARVTKTPQAVIDAFKGDMAFDPLGWCRLPAKDQALALRALVKGYDFEDAAERRAAAFASRTTSNRRAKEAEAAAAKVVLPAGKCPPAIDVSQKLAELREAEQYNAERAAASRLAESKTAEVNRLLDEAEQLRARAATLEKRAGTINDEVAALLDKWEGKQPQVDTAAIQADIARAQQTDEIRAAFQRREAFEREAKEAALESERLTNEIAEIDAAHDAAIAGAKLPVKGLALGDDCVMLDGLPLVQAGTARKIEAALAIAMAKNPDLKVILVDEGSELDSDTMEFIAGMAAKRGFQVWVAKVDESREVGFVIEDGRVAT